MTKNNTIRILILIAANKDWPLYQLDVLNAFLNEEFKEEMYMDMPPGVKHNPRDISKVCKLRKSLYDLK